MTKQEAIEAMKSGKRVTHRYFTNEEWMESNQSGTTFTFENGVKCSPAEFWHGRVNGSWEDGWGIVPKNAETEI